MRTRDRIIKASIELFNAQGERHVTTNHIAAHLGISPGNLYYHFRNKEDIIRNIFEEYTHHLEQHVVQPPRNEDPIESVAQYLDSVFELMWKFHFFYANLPDLLSRDEVLQKNYQEFQLRLLERVVSLIQGLKRAKIIQIDEEDILDFAHTIKLTVTFWVSYIRTQDPHATINQATIYQGVQKVLLLFKPYVTIEAKARIQEFEKRFAALANEVDLTDNDAVEADALKTNSADIQPEQERQG
ncbi:TetR/AcrR family transcriptional regulator [Algicola sagamiensis]|uniref:TetR/AcrR family transcriptional regulator n=1 Tax=Algicola sagamiensis TaxID=163869 RepID=UPI0003746F8A|nr:TetR/AcrR family transcriptional regulator [Algicola sagamiensis]